MARAALILALPALLLAAPMGRAQAPSDAAPPPPDAGRKIPIAEDSYARLGVSVTIAGRPCLFLVDTGSTRSVIAADLSQSLGLAPGPPLRVLNIGGVDTVASAIVPSLGFSDITVNDIDMPVLLRQNLGADGLLGLDVVRDRRLVIDFAGVPGMTLTASPAHERDPARDDDPNVIVVTAHRRYGQLIVTDAEIAGERVAVVIDTGSEGSIGNPALEAMMARRIAGQQGQDIALLSVTGRTLPGRFVSIGAVRIGGVEISNLPVTFANIATFAQFGLANRPALLLGMDTLRSFSRVTLDFRRHRITFAMVMKPVQSRAIPEM